MRDKKIKVLFDDIFFQFAENGIARLWLETLKRAIQDSEFKKNDIELTLISRSGKLDSLFQNKIDFPKYDNWQPATDRDLLSKVFFEGDYDIFVSSYFTFVPRAKNLTVIYDLIPEKFNFSRISRGWLEREMAIFCTDEFVCISESTKKDLLEFYPHIPEEHVRIAHPGIDQNIFYPRKSRDVRAFKKEYDLDKYLIFVGSRHQTGGYKNSKILFDAISNASVFAYDIVCVGGESLKQEEIDIVGKKGRRILRLALSDEQLAICATGATALLYPSLYEGFGIPPLECLSVGTPVITTMRSSLPESVGHLSIVIAGDDPGEVLDAITTASLDEHVGRIRIEGPEWASKFEWNEMSKAFVSGLIDLDARKLSEKDHKRHLVIAEYTTEAIKLQAL